MTTTPPPDNPVSNYVVSLLRTWVPLAWGGVLAWATSQIPALESYLNSPGMVAFGGALATLLAGVWYLLWRTVEQKLPAGLTRFLLGANSRPVYSQPLRGGFDDLPAETQASLRDKYNGGQL